MTVINMRPAQARRAILGAVRAGAVGTFHELAAHTGVPLALAQDAVHKLHYARAIAAIDKQGLTASAGRPRVVYAMPQAAAVDVLAYARQCWR